MNENHANNKIRKDGLASIVQQQFNLDPFTRMLFLFCGSIENVIPEVCRWNEWSIYLLWIVQTAPKLQQDENWAEKRLPLMAPPVCKVMCIEQWLDSAESSHCSMQCVGRVYGYVRGMKPLVAAFVFI